MTTFALGHMAYNVITYAACPGRVHMAGYTYDLFAGL